MTTAMTIAQSLRLRRSGNLFTGRCPACGYRGAFTVGGGRDGRPLVRCHACRDQDAVLDALRTIGLWSGRSEGHRMPRQASPVAAGESCAKREAGAAAVVKGLWRASEALPGTMAERYLRARGLDLAPPDDLRFLPQHRHRPTGTDWPVMLAAVRNAAGQLVGLHRTYLEQDGTGKAPIAPAKMSLGPIGGGAVRLAPAGPHLVVGEGIESTLSAMTGGGLPGWAALSTGGLRALVLPPRPTAARVTIAADGDSQGIAAARDAAMRWHAEGREVYIAQPPAPYADWNDAARGEVAHAR